MRKLFSLSIFSFAFFSCSQTHAPVDLGNENDVKKALSEKWEVEYMQMDGHRNKVPDSMAFQTEYLANGTYHSGFKNRSVKTMGNWNYDYKSHSIIIKLDETNIPSRIIKLDSKELVTAQYVIMNDVIRDSTIFTYRKI